MIHDENVLIFVPTHNAEGKKDVTGAFLPEAKAFGELAKRASIVQFDNSKGLPMRRAQVLKAIKERYAAVLDAKGSSGPSFSSVAFFCHGWMDGIQAGFQRRHAPELAEAIIGLCGTARLTIPLFCCSTGEDPQADPLTAVGTGDDSFADKLRDAMCVGGASHCRTVGHTTVAHATKNPMVLFMDGMGSMVGGVGGYPPVSPKSPLWIKWKKALQSTDLRFRMPYMSVAEIHAELTSAEGQV